MSENQLAVPFTVFKYKWLIDWLIDWFLFQMLRNNADAHISSLGYLWAYGPRLRILQSVKDSGNSTFLQKGQLC